MDPISTYAQQNLSQASKNVNGKCKEKYVSSAFPPKNVPVYQIQDLNDLNNCDLNQNTFSIFEDKGKRGVKVFESESSKYVHQNKFDNALLQDECDNNKTYNTTAYFGNNFDTKEKNVSKKVSGENEEKNQSKCDLESYGYKCMNLMSDVEIKKENIDIKDVSKINTITDNKITNAAEKIIYRNKAKNLAMSSKNPKKRVSFHEDILKNTRTDNIHIEHGFITYNNSGKENILPGRHSWCSNVETVKSNYCEEQFVFRCSGCERRTKSIAFRNAYYNAFDNGDLDIYENIESFGSESSDANNLKEKYKISSSNPSLHSTETINELKQLGIIRRNRDYTKSNSSDCIGLCEIADSYLTSKYCYFSEPSIEEPLRKSIWIKEKKPKFSCLKKSAQKNSFQEYEECDINKQMQKFNVHELKIFDKSKMILGTFKNIFTDPLPERGIPEGLENVQLVCEFAQETVHNGHKNSGTAARLKNLSKSLDGEKDGIGNITGCQNKFIHNVDEQLRKNEYNVFPQATRNSNKFCQSQRKMEDSAGKNFTDVPKVMDIALKEKTEKSSKTCYRNKYIINCVSTVYEHTAVSITNEDEGKQKPIKIEAVGENLEKDFMDIKPIKQTFVNIFNSIKQSLVLPISPEKEEISAKVSKTSLKSLVTVAAAKHKFDVATNSCSIEEDCEENVSQSSAKNHNKFTNSLRHKCSLDSLYRNASGPEFSIQLGESQPVKNLKEIESVTIPRKSNISRIFNNGNVQMIPDLFDCLRYDLRNLNLVLLNDKVGDLLQMSCNKGADGSRCDMVAVNNNPYMCKEKKNQAMMSSSNTIQLSLNSFFEASQSVLINRFLHNVTKNKIIESSIRNNRVFVNKIKEYKTFSGSLYIKRAKPLNKDLIEDLNAKIEMEMEMFGVGFDYDEFIGDSKNNNSEALVDISRFQLGIGEISAEIFNGRCLNLLTNENERLMKVFKLYAGYSEEGFITPVLVFLTDKALYVRNVDGNRLFNKYILKYSELDIILIGPHGNSVFFSNTSNDSQQVLLAGGPHAAEGLVANLELCLHQGGFVLPTVGQLTLENFGPLQAIVRKNLLLSEADNWVYYAVIYTPNNMLSNGRKKFLYPNIEGFFMYRRLQENFTSIKEIPWHIGFFLLRLDVLYMFKNSLERLPCWKLQLSQFQNVRRAETDRPYSLEILLKRGRLQLAAPDEYIVSEWIRAFEQVLRLQIEMSKKQKILGCTLIMTTNHLIMLREDFTGPFSFNTIKESIEKSHKTLSKGHFPEGTRISYTVPSVLNNDLVPNISRDTSKLERIQKTNIFIQKNINSHFSRQTISVEVLGYVFIEEITAIRIPTKFESLWCIIEFCPSKPEVSINDLVIFFSSNSEMQRFLRILEKLWQAKNIDLFPLTVLDEENIISKYCTNLFIDINKSWIPLLAAALTYSN